MGRSPQKVVIGGLCLGALFLAGIWMVRGRSGDDPSVTTRRTEPKVAPPRLPSGSIPAVEAPSSPPKGERSAPPTDPLAPETSSKPAGSPPLPKDTAALRNRALDIQARPAERLAAARLLHRDGFLKGMPEVLGAMALVLRSSSDESLRADICRSFRGTDSEELRRQLMTSAQSDASPRVRLEAVASLAGLTNADPIVRQFLEQAQERETDPDVKRELRRALTRKP